MVVYYTISGVSMRLELPFSPGASEAFSFYLTDEAAHPDVQVTVEQVNTLTEPEGALLYAETEFHVRRGPNGLTRSFFTCNEPTPYAVLEAYPPDRYFLRYTAERQEYFQYPGDVFRRIGLENILLQNGAFILHSSYIETPQGAILFTGPSGIGKSTQAALWEQYADATLVNGDRSGIRCGASDEVLAHGLPYAGSSRCFRNVTLPVAAIVRLDQGADNVVTPLSPAMAFRYLYEQTTVNTWDSDAVSRAVEMVGTVCERVPVYHFTCRKDGSAVTALRAAIFDKKV